MLSDILAVLFGIVCAGFGGDMFVRGAVGISKKLGIPARIIGVTIAAFATSSPECAVAITASLNRVNTISLGDALGSNVVNILLILGLALFVRPMIVPVRESAADLFWAAGAPVLIGILAADGLISRPDAMVLLGVFACWLIWTVITAVRSSICGSRDHTGRGSVVQSLLFLSIGLFFLVISGKAIVFGAVHIAERMGIDAFVIGATVVAIATGAPEFATTLIARLKGHDDLSLGTILGSNIFNALAIIACAAFILPIPVRLSSISVALLFGGLSLLFLVPRRGYLGRGRGLLLISGYVLYLLITLTVGRR